MRLPWSSKGLCVSLKADRREPKENALQIQTCVTKGVALADRKFAIVCHLYGRMFQGWRHGLQNRVWWVRFPTVRAIGPDHRGNIRE